VPKRQGRGRSITSFRINPELWRDVRVHALKRGMTVSELLEELLQHELGESRKPDVSRTRDLKRGLEACDFLKELLRHELKRG